MDGQRDRIHIGSAVMICLSLIGCAVWAGTSSLQANGPRVPHRGAPALGDRSCGGMWEWVNPLPQGNFLMGVAFGANLHIAVGLSGTILTSSDARSWAIQTSGTSEPLYGVCYGNSLWVAVGGSYYNPSTIVTSPDGIVWSAQTTNCTGRLTSVVYARSQFVAVGEKGILTSADGIIWTSQACGDLIGLASVTYGNSRFVAVGWGTPMISQDGVHWTQTTPQDTSLSSVTYGGSQFVAVGISGRISTSADGMDWRVQSSGVADSLYSVSCSNSRFLAVGANGTVITSPDGATWSQEIRLYANGLYGATFDGEQFVAVGSYGTIFASQDGTTWIDCAPGSRESLAGVAYGNSWFVALGQSGSVLRSQDGKTWSAELSGIPQQVRGIAFGGQTFVAMAHDWSSSDMIMLTSTDGTEWKLATVIPNHEILFNISFGNGRFMALSDYNFFTSTDGVHWNGHPWSGTGNPHYVAYAGGQYIGVRFGGNIGTSPDGEIWTYRWSGSTESLEAVAYGDGQYVVVGEHGTILTSPDSISWTPRASGIQSNLIDVAQGASYFVAVASGTQGESGGWIVTSPDGVTWTRSRIGASLFSVVFENSLFVAIGLGGSIIRSTCGCSVDCTANVPSCTKRGTPVSFLSLTQSSSCTGETSYAWGFGDGSTSIEQNPAHTYLESGAYTWTLTVSVDGQSCSQTGAIYVNRSQGIPGDCDGDGQISIGEVQKAINMFLGVQAPGDFVDCNEDGSVSIGEVQVVINEFLGTPRGADFRNSRDTTPKSHPFRPGDGRGEAGFRVSTTRLGGPH